MLNEGYSLVTMKLLGLTVALLKRNVSTKSDWFKMF